MHHLPSHASLLVSFYFSLSVYFLFSSLALHSCVICRGRQNNLHELWAMLNFLFPDIFVNSGPFDQCFDLAKAKTTPVPWHSSLSSTPSCEQPSLSLGCIPDRPPPFGRPSSPAGAGGQGHARQGPPSHAALLPAAAQERRGGVAAAQARAQDQRAPQRVSGQIGVLPRSESLVNRNPPEVAASAST